MVARLFAGIGTGLAWAGSLTGSGGVGGELFAGLVGFTVGVRATGFAVTGFGAGRSTFAGFAAGDEGFFFARLIAGGAAELVAFAFTIAGGLIAGLVTIGGHFIAEFADEFVEFALGEAGFSALVAEDGIGGPFDAIAEFIERAVHAGLFATGFVDKAALEKFGGGAELLFGAAGALLAEHIVEPTVKDRFGIFAVGRGLFETVDQVLVALALGIDSLGELFALGGAIE